MNGLFTMHTHAKNHDFEEQPEVKDKQYPGKSECKNVEEAIVVLKVKI